MIKLMSKFRKKDWFFLLIIIGFAIGQVYFELELPTYTAKIIRLMMDPTAGTSDIIDTGLSMLLMCLGIAVCAIFLGFFSTMIATNFSKTLRLHVFEKIESFSLEEMNQFEIASLITRTTNDVQQVQMGFGMSFRLIFMAPITAIWAITKIGNVSGSLSLAVGLVVLFLVALIAVIFTLVMPRFRRVQKLTDKLNDVTRDNLTGIRVVRAYDAEEYEKNKFEKANDDLTRNNLIANRIMSLLGPAMSISMSGISLIVYWFGAHLISKGNLNYADLTSFISYSIQILLSFVMLSMLLIMIPRASVSASRILEVLNTKNKIVNPKVCEPIRGEAHLEFKNVSFKYPGDNEAAISNINFDVKKGETLAIIGATGSGKSSIVNLIPRFYDVTSGEVLINGSNIKQYDKKDLRDYIGYVPQQKYLFSGDIKSNIKFTHNHVTNLEMQEAARIANANEFIDKLPETYDSHVSQGGKNLSGGQQQRVAIARAIAKNPSIYIFDDSFSALDYRTDREVRSRLKNKTKDAISIIVAQRIGTIMDADKIVVLEKGHIVGYGTHDELLKSCDTYREIALSQLSKEELGL